MAHTQVQQRENLYVKIITLWELGKKWVETNRALLGSRTYNFFLDVHGKNNYVKKNVTVSKLLEFLGHLLKVYRGGAKKTIER